MTAAETPVSFKRTMIAPCGMNCGICIAHLREKNHCPGCRSASAELPRYCSRCVMRNCRKLNGGKGRCGTSCEEFPCRRLRQLDKRYRTRYGVSLIGNLREIEESGIRTFLVNEAYRWRCTQCGAVLSIHRNECLQCNTHFSKERSFPLHDNSLPSASTAR